MSETNILHRRSLMKVRKERLSRSLVQDTLMVSKSILQKQELNINLQELDQIPKKRMNLVKVVEVAIPVIFFSVIGWIIYSTGIDPWNKIKDIFLVWFLVHGILSAVGARNRTRTSFINSYCVCGCPVYVFRTVFRTRMVRRSCRSKITKTYCKRFPGFKQA